MDEERRLFGLPFKVATDDQIMRAMDRGKMVVGVDRTKDGGADMCCEAYHDKDANTITIVDIYPLAT